MAAEVYSLKAIDGKKLPAIVLCHGWGGTARDLRPEGIAFARAGYLAVAIDYRGWGESDARLVLTGPSPSEKPKRRFTAEVQEVREVVDPIDQTTDLLNAVHWVVGEPQCDPAGIGLWGSSYSGGHVVYPPARSTSEGHRQPGARTRLAPGSFPIRFSRRKLIEKQPGRTGRDWLSRARGHA